MSNCILCNSKAVINLQENAGRIIYNCPMCGVFVVSDTVERTVKQQAMKVSAFLINRKLRGLNDIVFISFENNKANKGYLQVTVDQISDNLPETFTERLDAAMENLALKSSFPGDEIRIDRHEFAGMFYVYHPGSTPLVFMIKALSDRGLITVGSQNGSFFPCNLTITSHGWEHVEKLRLAKSGRELALFSLFDLSEDEDSGAFLKDLAKACKSCGLRMVNSALICPEGGIGNQMLAQFRSSRVVVCDLSDGTGQSYYLAGMARAAKKICVLTCNEKNKDNLMINSGELNVLFWEDYEDFIEKVTQAIQALM